MSCKKIIHVNQYNIRKNIKGKDNLPVITVKTYKSNTYGHRVEIEGDSQVIYPEKQLACGARVWMETKGLVKVYDKDDNLIEVLF